MTYAQKYIDPLKLDKEILNKLEKHPELIEILDDWILSPDTALLPKLKQVMLTFNKIQPPPSFDKIYRGFDRTSSYQDTMGLSKKGFFRNTVSKFNLGDKLLYESANPLSFTPDLKIAKDFGSLIVFTQWSKVKERAFYITDEMSYLVSKRRNLQAATQSEIVVFPGKPIEFTIMEYDGKSIFNTPAYMQLK